MNLESGCNFKRKSQEDISKLPEKVAKMSAAHPKTPVQILQELCAKKKLAPTSNPVYTDIHETPTHSDVDKRFAVKCTAMGLTSIGHGVTKKAAKHAAAQKLFRKYENPDDFDDEDDDDDDDQAQASVNAVSGLLDFCVQAGLHKPIFTCISDYGPSNAPTFVYECKLDSEVGRGTSGNKKAAKQEAARVVLDNLKLAYPDIEKKLALPNGQNTTEENIRQKVLSYRELKALNKTHTMGRSIKDRHHFFKQENEDLYKAVCEILKSTELNDREKYENLIKELNTMWPSKVGTFITGESGLAPVKWHQFELEVDFDKFTCCIIGSEQELWKEVLEYFNDMFDIDAGPVFDVSDGLLEPVLIESM